MGERKEHNNGKEADEKDSKSERKLNGREIETE